MFIGDTTMFSQRLKILRKSFDLSQAKFAKEIGFSQSAIASWENETREPGINALIKIAQYFNTSVDYLIGLPTTAITPEKPAPLPPETQELVNIYQALSPAHRSQILEYARYFAEKSGAASTRRKA